MLKLFFSVFFLFTFFYSYNQCKQFTKKFCLEHLKPYTFNGQLNMTVLKKGEMAELYLTFYKDHEYRIFVCSQENLGNVEFRFLDSKKNEIFNNKDHNYTKYWDFKATASAQFILQVYVPPSPYLKDSSISGCISILVGFKE